MRFTARDAKVECVLKTRVFPTRSNIVNVNYFAPALELPKKDLEYGSFLSILPLMYNVWELKYKFKTYSNICIGDDDA